MGKPAKEKTKKKSVALKSKKNLSSTSFSAVKPNDEDVKELPGSTSNMNTDSEENNKRKIILRVNEEPLEYFHDMPPRKLKKLSYLKLNSSLMRKVEEATEDVVRPLKEDAKKKETPVENDNGELEKKRKRIVSKGRNKSMESTAEVEKPDSGRRIRGKKKKGLSENPEKEETSSEKKEPEPDPLKE